MSKIYPVRIVGVQFCQEALAFSEVGERVYICREEGNPHDDRALKVETAGGQTLGYISRGSWLREAIWEQGRGATATVAGVGASDSGLLGMTINVSLSDDDLRDTVYSDRQTAA